MDIKNPCIYATKMFLARTPQRYAQIPKCQIKEGKSYLFLKCRISNLTKDKIVPLLFYLSLLRRISNFINMQQRIITISQRFKVMDQYAMNLDEVTTNLNKEGWTIKQVVSTTFEHRFQNGNSFPVLVISLLVEKA